jgi:hypothetical protein
MPADLLIKVHEWAEAKGLDLATALRDLTALGQEAAARPSGQDSPAVRTAAKKWSKPVERALRAGQSPLHPLLGQDISPTDLDAMPRILADQDYHNLFQALTEKAGTREERVWACLKTEASKHISDLMESLDALDEKLLARKKLFYKEGSDGEVPVLHWLLSASVMQILDGESSKDKDVEAVRKLIAARYLVAENPTRPWEFVWDD